MEIEDAIHTALMTLKEGFEGNFLYISGQMDSTNIEVGVIREDKKFHVLTPSQIKEYLDELQWKRIMIKFIVCILSLFFLNFVLKLFKLIDCFMFLNEISKD